MWVGLVLALVAARSKPRQKQIQRGVPEANELAEQRMNNKLERENGRPEGSQLGQRTLDLCHNRRRLALQTLDEIVQELVDEGHLR